MKNKICRWSDVVNGSSHGLFPSLAKPTLNMNKNHFISLPFGMLQNNGNFLHRIAPIYCLKPPHDHVIHFWHTFCSLGHDKSN